MKGRGIGDQVRIHGRNSTCRTHLCVCDYSRVGALSPAWHHQVAEGNVRERTHDSPLRSRPHTIQRNQSFPILLMTQNVTREFIARWFFRFMAVKHRRVNLKV